MAGLQLDEWQANDVRDMCAVDERGDWLVSEAALVVARQNGKGAVTECLQLADLFLWDQRLVVHTAHEFQTSQEAFLRVAGLVENTPQLSKRLAIVRTSNGKEGIELKSGARLRFRARSKSAMRGFTTGKLYFDEAYDLTEDQVAASTPAMATVRNSQIVYTSTPPLPGQESEVLDNVRLRAMSDSPGRLCYLEHSADPGCERQDRQAWADANPGLGIRISEQFLADQYSRMSQESFAREHLCIWSPRKDFGAVNMRDWNAASDWRSLPAQDATPAFAFDVSPNSESAAIVVACEHSDGQRVHVELVEHRANVGWLVDVVPTLTDRIVADPGSQAGEVIPLLKAAGVDVVQVKARDTAAAAGGFTSALAEDVLRIRRDEALTEAAQGARRRPLADAWAWKRKNVGVDISPLVAASLAVWAFRGRDTGPDYDVLESFY